MIIPHVFLFAFREDEASSKGKLHLQRVASAPARDHGISGLGSRSSGDMEQQGTPARRRSSKQRVEANLSEDFGMNDPASDEAGAELSRLVAKEVSQQVNYAER